MRVRGQQSIQEKIIGGGGLSDLQVFGSSDLLVSSFSGPLFSLFSDLLVFWSLSSSPGLQVFQVFWLSGLQVFWSLGLLVLVLWSSGLLVFRSTRPVSGTVPTSDLLHTFTLPPDPL